MKKSFVLLFLLALLASPAWAQSTCAVSGTALRPNGSAAAGVKIKVVKVTSSSQTTAAVTDEYTTGADGSFTLTILRSSSAEVCTPGISIVGISSDCSKPTRLTIPDAATATFLSVMATNTVPTPGMVVQDEGTALATRIGTINCYGAGINCTQTSAGVARIEVSNNGTVASVGLSLPNIFTVTGSPVTGTGTLTATLANQPANTSLMGPQNGADAAPTFRSLVAADIPDLSATYQLTDPDLSAVSNLLCTGILVRTGSNTFTCRTLTAGNSTVTVTNGNGASLNPTVSVNQNFGFSWTNTHSFSPGSSTTQANAIGLTLGFPSADGAYDGHALYWLTYGQASGIPHTVEWRVFPDVTSNAGVSKLAIQSALDAADWTERFSVTDGGIVAATGLTLSGRTNGRMLFYNNGVVDDSNLLWDNTNKYLSLGVTSPDTRLSIQQPSSGADLIALFNNSGAKKWAFNLSAGNLLSWTESGVASNRGSVTIFEKSYAKAPGVGP